MAKKKPSWLAVSGSVRAEAAQGVYSAAYSLAELAEKNAIDPEKFKGFRQRSRLETVTWRAGWSRADIIAAGGLVLTPEASSGCSCGYPVRATMAFVSQ